MWSRGPATVSLRSVAPLSLDSLVFEQVGVETGSGRTSRLPYTSKANMLVVLSKSWA